MYGVFLYWLTISAQSYEKNLKKANLMTRNVRESEILRKNGIKCQGYGRRKDDIPNSIGCNF